MCSQICISGPGHYYLCYIQAEEFEQSWAFTKIFRTQKRIMHQISFKTLLFQFKTVCFLNSETYEIILLFGFTCLRILE